MGCGSSTSHTADHATMNAIAIPASSQQSRNCQSWSASYDKDGNVSASIVPRPSNRKTNNVNGPRSFAERTFELQRQMQLRAAAGVRGGPAAQGEEEDGNAIIDILDDSDPHVPVDCDVASVSSQSHLHNQPRSLASMLHTE